MLKRNKIVYVFLGILCFLSCSAIKKEIPDGGSCSYRHEFYPTVILSLYCDEFDRCGMELLQLQPWKDTVYYNQINHGFLYSDTLTARNLKEGDTITYEVMYITKGSCSPMVDHLWLDQRYKTKK